MDMCHWLARCHGGDGEQRTKSAKGLARARISDSSDNNISTRQWDSWSKRADYNLQSSGHGGEVGGCEPRRWNRLCYVLESKTPAASRPSRICMFAPISWSRAREKERDWYGGAGCGVVLLLRTKRWDGRMESEKCRCWLTKTAGRDMEWEEKKTTSVGWFRSLTTFRIACTLTTHSRRRVFKCIWIVCVCVLYDASSKSTLMWTNVKYTHL